MIPSKQATIAGGPAPQKTGHQAWTLPDETVCIARLKQLRWTNGPYCPYCGHQKIYNLSTTRLPLCGACKNTFSVKVGTIFQGSPLPLSKWFTAIRLVTDPEKAVTTTWMAEVLRVGESTAWLMLRRLRHAAATASFNRRIRAAAGVRAVRSQSRPAGPKTPAPIYATKFRIDMPFEEALVRFAGVEHRELQGELARPSRKRMSRVPKAKSAPPPGESHLNP